jgi:AcrR family transcriptional regulator
MFLRDGYHATSLEKVAEAAGYSKGAVYSNFRNKHELCMAAIDAIHEREMHTITESLGAATTLEQRLTAFSGWADRMIGDESWTVLLVEFASEIKRTPAIRKQLASRERIIADGISQLLAHNGKEFGLRAKLPYDVIAQAMLSMGIGLGIQRSIDPSMRVGVLTEVLRTLLDPAE